MVPPTSTLVPSAARRALVAAVLVATIIAAAAPAGAQDPGKAPVTTLSNGGRSVSDGVRSLSVSQAADLDPAGQTISVSGAGFDASKGIYVAFCLIPPTNQPPTPCGGGRADQTGAVGASMWLRSDDYGQQNSATPFGPGGTFSATMTLHPEIAPGIDCRQARCAVVSRADHKATADRSFDLFVPIGFGAPRSTDTTATTEPPPAPTVPTTVPALQATQVAPTATVAPDGGSVTDGTRTLRASPVTDLDPETATVTVEGSGFDSAKGIFVSLCAVPAADPALPAGAAAKPAPCAGGGPEVSHWVSSNPPEYGEDLAVPYAAGGAFAAELTLGAVIDDDHDCRKVACALVARNDDTNPVDRTQDIYLPVTFAASTAATAAADVAAGSTGDTEVELTSDDDGGNAPVVAGVGAGVVVLGLLVGLFLRRRAAAGSTDS